MAERQKLTITEVLEPRTIGDKNIPLQEFHADGKKYSVFSKSLFPYIKLNTEIDAEVEVKEGENYTNRKIVDIFVDGKSVKSQGQGGYRGKSPEELDLNARSYALAYAKDLAVAGKIEVKDIIPTATEYYDWLRPTTKAPVEGPEATQEQKDELATYDKKRVAEMMKKLGIPRTLTKLNADILLDELKKEAIALEEAGKPFRFKRSKDE